MAELELRTIDGKTERRELSRKSPLSIGRQAFNDIAVADDGVGALHCRIAWNSSAYEVTAAVKEGVDLNGKLIDHAVLKSGDVLRIGAMDLVFRDSSAQRQERDGGKKKPAGSEKDSGLKLGKPSNGAKDKPAKQDADNNELSLFQGPIIAESLAEMIVEPDVVADSSDEMSGLMLARNLSQGETISRGGRSVGEGARPKQAIEELNEFKRNVSTALKADRVRPGEHDILRSPLVLGLGGGSLVVLLVAATIWFLMGRQVAQQLYDRAVNEFASGQHSQAITSFESFLEKYPGHALSVDARIGVGKARIEKELSGATPSWKRGLEQLEAFIEEHRNDTDFKALQPGICEFAEKIATGSAKSAEALKDPELLTVSADGARRLSDFSDPQNPPTTALEQIRVATELAKAAITKQRTIDDAFAIINQALAERQPITVLRERAKLIKTYVDVESQKKVKDALRQAIELEKSVIAVADLNQPASTEELPGAETACVIPVDHTRSRTDESAIGRYVYAQVKDACFAVEIVTGEVAWRRLTGVNPPFFPLLTSGAQPGLLLGEAEPPSLVLRHAETGALLWRQTFAEPLSGAPLIHEGEIFIASKNRSLYRLDLDTGRLKEQMTFSQDILGPPTLAPGGEHLFVAGETALIYSLSIRPLKVAAVTFSAHPPDSIAVPLLTLGRLVLMCENDRLDSCRLRVFDASQPLGQLDEAKSVRIEGQVVDRPVLRGNQLVVASTGERLQAFTVSDEPDRKGLSLIGNYKVQEGYAGPMQLALGPDQQFWLASSAFRRFEVSNDSLRADANTTAPGIASQPLQLVGEQFFVARRPPYAHGVILTQVDRERMSGSWRTTLGARFLAWTPARNDGLVAVTETGTVFSLSAARLRQGGVELRAGLSLEIPPDVAEPLGAVRLSDGRLALWCSGSKPKLWLINAQGQMESERELDAPLSAAPVLLKQGLVLPQAGRLKWLGAAKDSLRVQDYLAPQENNTAPQWRYLLALDDEEFLVCDDDGRLSRIQIRRDDVVHLAEAAKFKLPQPVEVPPVLLNGDLWIADAAATLYRLDGRSFDVKAQRTFPSPIRGVWTDGTERYVQLLDGTLHCIADAADLADAWSSPFAGLEFLDSPLRRGEELICLDRRGTAVRLNAATGQETARTRLPQPLTLGPLAVGGEACASAIDGAVYRVTFPEGGQP